MKKLCSFLVFCFAAFSSNAQTKVIDMHIHSYTDCDFGEREPAQDYYGAKGSANSEAHRLATFAALKKYNIVKAVVSGNPESVETWAAKDSNHIVIKGLLIFSIKKIYCIIMQQGS